MWSIMVMLMLLQLQIFFIMIEKPFFEIKNEVIKNNIEMRIIVINYEKKFMY